MNILVLSWRDPKHPLAGGAEQVMHEHAKGWVAAGHNVTLFAAHFNDAPHHEILDGMEVLRYGYQLLGVHAAAFFWYLFGKHLKFDLIVDQFHGIPFFTPLYMRVPKLAVLQEVAKEVWLINQLPKPFNWIVGWTGYLAEPFIFTPYKNVPFMVGSESAKADLVAFGIQEKNVTVVPHGVIVKRPRPFPKKEKIKTVMFLGALTRDKGIEDAIRAFGVLKGRGSFNFWVVGRGTPTYTTYLKRLTVRFGIANKVKFFGFVSQDRKFNLLARAHVLVNPSIREGWGLVNIEANAMGTPVVAYKSPGLIDSVEDGESGFLCRGNTPLVMADTVIRLLIDKIIYRKIQRSSFFWSRKFSWEISRKASLQIINRTVE